MLHSVRVVNCFALLIGCSAAPLRADDWPQWMGPGRDGVWTEKGIIAKFPPGGPKELWRVPVGLGYAGPAVVGNRVFLFDYVKKEGDVVNNPGARVTLSGSERLLCLDAKSGKTLWKVEYDAPYSISYPSGPRCTPTVDGDKVYALGAEGKLLCLNAADGAEVWSRELKKDYKCESPIWGFSASPLVDGDLLYSLVGGEGSIVVAFDKATGKEVWKALSASETGYAPPSILESGGKRQLIIWDADKINGLDPKTGAVYWSEKLKPAYGMSIMMPRRWGDFLFASGIGNQSALFKLDVDRPGAKLAWSGGPKTAVHCANATPLIDPDGTLYGVDCQSGDLIAVDLKDGERLWTTSAPTSGKRRAQHGTAFLIRNGDRYFMMSETGDLVIAKLSREKYEEIDRAHLLEPTGEAFGRSVVWSHPAFARQCVFARNDKECVCFALGE